MKKVFLSLLAVTVLTVSAVAQNVTIPDAAFKAYLIGESSINTNMDTEIQLSEAVNYNGSIICTVAGITDLTGIEAFVALTELNVYDNDLTTLDVSQNTNLTTLVCPLNDLDVLDVSANTMLSVLNCENNNLTAIDVSQNLLLTQLFCSNNDITSIDVTQNANLSNLHVYNNELSAIDVTQNPMLQYFYCQQNNIMSLDMSQNTSMSYFTCTGNELVNLNMKNISTSTLTNFIAVSNPNLTCIEVDDVSAATSAWTNIDAASSFNLSCITYVTSISVVGSGGASQITTNGGTLQMLASVSPANADDATYTWSVVDGTGSASINASGLLTAISNGTVTVTATANDASGTTGSAVITISNQSSAGINEQAASIGLSVYPNPVKTQFTVDAKEEVKSIVFINLMGKKVKTIIAPIQAIDVSDLAKGVYMLQIQFENTIVIQRLIKE